MTEKSDKRRRRGVVDLIAHIDPVGIVGILLSVILSVVLDLTNIATGVESLLSCLVGITLSLVLDSIARAERRVRIRSMLEAVPWFGESFFALAERTTNIARQFPNSRVLLEARQKYEALQDELDDLCRGRIVRSGNDYEHLLTGIQAATTIVEAATNVLPDGEGQSPTRWWQSDLGRHYWDLNLDAIRRGVRIIRIVTYSR